MWEYMSMSVNGYVAAGACVCVRARIDSPEDQLISGLSERQETGSENGHHRALWMWGCEYTVLRFSFRCNGALKPV